MNNKTITIGLAALAFVTGSIMTMSGAYAATQGQPFQELDKRITALEENSPQSDSFFDVFTELGFTVESFFDVFTELQNAIGDPDFDLLRNGDPDFDTEVEARKQADADILSAANQYTDSFFDVFVEVDLPSCSDGQVIKRDSSSSTGWVCAPDEIGGGGVISSQSCTVGQFVNGINADGTIICLPLSPDCSVDVSAIRNVITDLRGCDFHGADFHGVTLSPVDLRGANLVGTNIGNSLLRDANLVGADLTDAILFGSSLEGADLTGANLRGANLDGTHLRNADFTGANLMQAFIRNADLTNADLSDANLRLANLSGSNLGNVDLFGADLTDAILAGTYASTPCFGNAICLSLPTTP